jgi:hypothetical protein
MTRKGCDGILTNLAITPVGEIASCCGLAMESIPEMKLGSYGHAPLKDIADTQFADFLKLWLWVDGPHRIVEFLRNVDEAIPAPEDLPHPCRACSVLYTDPRARTVLSDHYRSRVRDVFFRFQLKRKLLSDLPGFSKQDVCVGPELARPAVARESPAATA